MHMRDLQDIVISKLLHFPNPLLVREGIEIIEYYMKEDSSSFLIC